MNQAIYLMSLISMVLYSITNPSQKASNLKSGDEAVKQDFEHRASSFSISEWLENKIKSPTEMAESNRKGAISAKAVTLYNPYEGQFCGRQLGESVEDFLQRLPPQITTVSDLIPWIFIANPFQKAPKLEKDQQAIKGEGPLDEDSDWAQFVILGNNLLEELTRVRHDIEQKKAGQAKISITKAVNVQRDVMVKKLLDTAIELHCTTGKVGLDQTSCKDSTDPGTVDDVL
jgi:hypothetical protein